MPPILWSRVTGIGHAPEMKELPRATCIAPELRRRVIDLIESGRSVAEVAAMVEPTARRSTPGLVRPCDCAARATPQDRCRPLCKTTLTVERAAPSPRWEHSGTPLGRGTLSDEAPRNYVDPILIVSSDNAAAPLDEPPLARP